ncbi:MAG: hypothetical protein A2Z14_11155 [Chloroflexi bacterium RBG_16_48_8]|nr:MAG: hypothetical protein A2Z14_11155 [Chloroflexi bacterium RBG_16_48_8]
MSNDRRFFNVALPILITLVLVFYPITYGDSGRVTNAFTQGTIAFTPSIATLQVTQTLAATPMPTVADDWYLEEEGFSIPSYERVTCVDEKDEVCY